MSLSCALQQIQTVAASLCLSTLHDALWLVLPFLIHQPLMVISAASLQVLGPGCYVTHLHRFSCIAGLATPQVSTLHAEGTSLDPYHQAEHACCVALPCSLALLVAKP